MSKLLSLEAAARLVPDGAVVTVSASSGLGCPDALLKAVGERFAATGFAPFRAVWEAADRYRGKRVTLALPAAAPPRDAVVGIALGVGGSGALRIETAEGVREFIAGEVSLRGDDAAREGAAREGATH